MVSLPRDLLKMFQVPNICQVLGKHQRTKSTHVPTLVSLTSSEGRHMTQKTRKRRVPCAGRRKEQTRGRGRGCAVTCNGLVREGGPGGEQRLEEVRGEV